MQKPVEVKKQRTRRPPEMIAELIMEAERNQNQAAICRRENIQPNLFSRWKTKFKEAGVEGLKSLKRGRKPLQDPKLAQLEKELAQVKSAFVDQSVELQLLKKSVSSGYMET